MFFLVDHVLPVVLAHFHIWSQLYGIGGASIFAEPTENTAREINAEPFRETPAVFVLRGLQRDTVHWTYGSTKVAAHAAFPAVRITRENDATAITRSQVGFLFGILHRHSVMKRMQEHIPDGSQQTQHGSLPSCLISLGKMLLAIRKHDRTRPQNAVQRQGQHQLPSPGHQLIKSGPGQRRTQQNKKANEQKHLDEKPNDWRQPRTQPSAKKQYCDQG